MIHLNRMMNLRILLKDYTIAMGETAGKREESRVVDEIATPKELYHEKKSSLKNPFYLKGRHTPTERGQRGLPSVGSLSRCL